MSVAPSQIWRCQLNLPASIRTLKTLFLEEDESSRGIWIDRMELDAAFRIENDGEEIWFDINDDDGAWVETGPYDGISIHGTAA